METLFHLTKSNMGSGLFAMGDAFKNAGLLLGPILTIVLGTICVYSFHILVSFIKHYFKTCIVPVILLKPQLKVIN